MGFMHNIYLTGKEVIIIRYKDFKYTTIDQMNEFMSLFYFNKISPHS